MNEPEILQALDCIYPIDEVNDVVNTPITIYKGSLEVSFNDDDNLKTRNYDNCTLQFVFQPFPKVELIIQGLDNDVLDYYRKTEIDHNIRVTLPDCDKKADFCIIVYPPENTLRGILNSSKEDVNNYIVESFKNNQLSYIRFSLLNFKKSDMLMPDKFELSADNFKIIVRRLSTYNKKSGKLVNSYAITYFGVIVVNGDQNQSFTIDFLDILGSFLSFLQGYWVAPCLMAGYNANNQKIWEFVEPITKIDFWKASELSWLDREVLFEIPNCLQQVFEGFLEKCNNELWKEPIRLGIHWYIESNKQAGAIEGSIIFIQSALEMFSWVLLVEDKKMISAYGFNDLPASDKISLLLSQCNIPIEIPENLNILTAIKKENDRPKNLAELLTYVRNKITHPSPKNRKQLSSKVSDEDLKNTYRLGRWLLELTLLSLFNYNSYYFNCSSLPGKVELVPWATENED